MATSYDEESMTRHALESICAELNLRGKNIYQQQDIEQAIALTMRNPGVKIGPQLFQTRGPEIIIEGIRYIIENIDTVVALATLADVLLNMWKAHWPRPPEAPPQTSDPQLEAQKVDQAAEAVWREVLERTGGDLGDDVVFLPDVRITKGELLQMIRRAVRKAVREKQTP